MYGINPIRGYSHESGVSIRIKLIPFLLNHKGLNDISLHESGFSYIFIPDCVHSMFIPDSTLDPE